VDLLTFEKNDIPVPEMDGRPVTEELSTVEVTCPVSVKQQFFNGLLGNRPNVFCWASDYLIWSSFWPPE
jgi:hypothetical protein